MDPIHQFEIKNLFPIARIGGMEIAFTNSALFMLIGLLLILLLMLGATSRARSSLDGCNRSPKCPTNSSRRRCGALPAPRA